MNIEFKKPKRSEYEQIANLVNSAEEIFFSIRNPEIAKVLETAEESVGKLVQGEEKREYLCLYDDGELCAFSSYRFKN